VKKIIIIGCPGSGKTTLANKLGDFLHIPVYHLDKLFWKDNWIPSHQVDFIKAQNEIMEKDRWIVDGGFVKSKSFDIRLNNADAIVFFDFPKVVIFWRTIKRFFVNFNKVRPDMGGNNKQKVPLSWGQVKFAMSYPTQKVYEKVMSFSQTKKIVILRTKKEEATFLKSLI